MNQHGKRGSDDRLLMALACGATVENAARSTGVSDRTVYRRLKDPAFQRRLQQLRADMVQRTAGVMIAAATEAVKTLLSLMKPEIPPAVRLGASRAVIELGLKVKEVSDLEARLVALEEQLGEGK